MNIYCIDINLNNVSDRYWIWLIVSREINDSNEQSMRP